MVYFQQATVPKDSLQVDGSRPFRGVFKTVSDGVDRFPDFFDSGVIKGRCIDPRIIDEAGDGLDPRQVVHKGAQNISEEPQRPYPKEEFEPGLETPWRALRPAKALKGIFFLAPHDLISFRLLQGK
jgi:hypothetical protein